VTAGESVGRRLVVVSGPGGVGKGTVVKALLRRHPQLAVSVSATTRRPRPGETDGVEYHFLEEDTFDALIESDGFVEWAAFGGRRYGTPWTSLNTALERGATVLLEIDVQGALQVRERFLDALLVFLTPPSLAELQARLEGRGTDDSARIAERMRIAEWEMAQSASFDHIITNTTVESTVEQIGRILGF
jgi:guanylate kinase